ncbi:flagellar biosynthesis protein FlhF [Paenibacillus piri]|uniref:Flagellar biosynthesis protein FlhF n=1 Tax=Paenibacillus piri TaxID=2547395 RepID=A0A4R5KR43_9BACL|nr:flagellar biosynthesis protein FlhF [Paenibacillus piri]TDF98211.1 flagellar biosynthesis protein FlhF [Paenibacillus piri]
MRVKRYVVDSMPDALQKIRTDLGKDAVILNTKEIRSGGFLGMFSKKKIEVIAATDQSAAPAGQPGPVQTKLQPAMPQAAAHVQPLAHKRAEPQQRELPKAAYGSLQVAQQAYARPVMAAAVTPKHPDPGTSAAALSFPEVPDVVIPEVAAASAFVPPAASVKAEPAAAGTASDRANPKEDVLLDEIKQMKELMHKLSAQTLQQSPVAPVLAELQQRLLEQELDPLLVQDIVAGVAEEAKAEGTELTEESARASIRSRLLDLFTIGESKQMSPDTRVVHFVGPTGVGKTTTIAKLAAEQVLKYNRKVGFITSDTYRIAAVEQLKTYATILNVPLEVVFSPQDLSKAYEQLKDRDLIFMDTAGRNYRNEMYVSELNALLNSQGKSETFLVMSLTTKYKDMKAITENFSKFKLDKVLFTKMDETESLGPIVNLVHDFKLQLSYVTNGQSVPDDITELAEHHIIDLILGARKDE